MPIAAEAADARTRMLYELALLDAAERLHAAGHEPTATQIAVAAADMLREYGYDPNSCLRDIFHEGMPNWLAEQGKLERRTTRVTTQGLAYSGSGKPRVLELPSYVLTTDGTTRLERLRTDLGFI